jgi:hypothetical protein
MNYCVILSLLVLLSVSADASKLSVFYDYDSHTSVSDKNSLEINTPGHRAKLLEDNLKEKMQSLIDKLNLDPANEDHFGKVIVDKDLLILYRAGVHLLSSPISLEKQGVITCRDNKSYVDSRALHLLSFVHLMSPKIDPWLNYHFALAIVYFPELALALEYTRNRETSEEENPLTFAYKIYDRWLYELKIEELAEDFQIIEDSSIPLSPTSMHHMMPVYEDAHRKFFALLSQKMINPGEYSKELMEGIIKYSPDRNVWGEDDDPNQSTIKPQGDFLTWFKKYSFVTFFSIPALMLVSHVSKSLNH